MRVLAIQNCTREGFGSYVDRLQAEGVALEIVHPYRGDPLPPLDGWEAVLIGGTPISVTEADRHPFLVRESLLVADAVARGVPCLGVCAGAQLLAQVLGARVTPNPAKEIGGYEVHLTELGAADPLFRGFPRHFPVFHWHGDTFGIPSGEGLLAEGDTCRNQAFRSGRAVGLQFHLEVSPAEAVDWARGYAHELGLFGKSARAVVDGCVTTASDQQRLATSLIRNFLQTLETDRS